jgi:translation initiation factor IF-2
MGSTNVVFDDNKILKKLDDVEKRTNRLMHGGKEQTENELDISWSNTPNTNSERTNSSYKTISEATSDYMPTDGYTNNAYGSETSPMETTRKSNKNISKRKKSNNKYNSQNGGNKYNDNSTQYNDASPSKNTDTINSASYSNNRSARTNTNTSDAASYSNRSARTNTNNSSSVNDRKNNQYYNNSIELDSDIFTVSG